MNQELVKEVIDRYDGDHGMLIPMMQDLQMGHGYLPAEQLRSLASGLGIPLTRVYGVAMFYSSFRLAPKGQHEVTLCMGTVCHLKGAPRISEECRRAKRDDGYKFPPLLAQILEFDFGPFLEVGVGGI